MHLMGTSCWKNMKNMLAYLCIHYFFTIICMDHILFWHFILAGLLGALIGAEREMPASGRVKWGATGIGWVRSYALMAIMGALMTWLDISLKVDIWKIVWFFVSAVFLIVSYVYASFQQDRMGVTSEYAAFITYLIGVIVMLWHTVIAVILSIVLLMLLSSKYKIHKLQKKISREEFGNTLKFAVISLVVLPLLPNVRYSIADMATGLIGSDVVLTHPVLTMDFFNPFSVWFFVVIMAGVEYIGYILSKILGRRGGAVLSGAIGWLISSTAVTGAMTAKSKDRSGNTYAYVAATLIASIIMCIRVIVVSSFYNPDILSTIVIPAVAMLVGLSVAAWYFYRKDQKRSSKKKPVVHEEYQSPFSLIPAIQFALIIVVVKFVSGIGLIYQNLINAKVFYYVLGIFSGLADVDAITMDMSGKSLEWSLPLLIAASTILIATISNNVVKASISYRFGEKIYGRSVAIGFGISIILGLSAIILMNIVSQGYAFG